MQIDHDPEEPKIDRDRSPFSAPWPAVFLFLLFLWAANIYSSPLDWLSVILGFLTGMLITAWFFDWHGTDQPKSWRGHSRNG